MDKNISPPHINDVKKVEVFIVTFKDHGVCMRDENGIWWDQYDSAWELCRYEQEYLENKYREYVDWMITYGPYI